MTITAEQIDSWRSVVSEAQNLEFKEAKQQYDTKKLFKYCVALANECGGYLLLGVADKAPRAIVGTQAFLNVMDITALHIVSLALEQKLIKPEDPANGSRRYSRYVPYWA